MSEFSLHHAVVTGGGTGIGLAIADALAEMGARVTIMSRNKKRLEEAAKGISGECQVVRLDVSDGSAVNEAFDQATREFGEASILVNNAGIAWSEPTLKMPLEKWDDIMAVNLKGPFMASRRVLPGMIEAGWGRIINIASTAGLKGYPYAAAYCAAKHGLVGLTRALAQEFAKSGVTVNAVCPSFTDTDIMKRALERRSEKTGASAEEARAEIESLIPMGRLITPQEVSRAVLYLCSDGASAVTGETLAVAGGEV